MTQVLERAITATTMRMAIRAKIRVGVNQRSISLLIQAYAPAAAPGRDDGETGLRRRLAVEVIPNARRAAFLAALDQLQDDLSIAEAAQLAG